jgi:hypothetical protein
MIKFKLEDKNPALTVSLEPSGDGCMYLKVSNGCQYVYIAELDTNGTLNLCSGISKDMGLQVDDNGIIITNISLRRKN